ncbi:DUF4974 domain-containing protein [Chitinophaga horti]|uniref:DUF4974 domain-containing protein n=1 Tax=Chitinophaga horti TaxID=2920382 RepID=A0ABY6J617_9BACT|nr:FecR domain-containing protein [Chitinophaga horti]UYQ95121.1 DUF4974 domain-containing protein [Chitinophaga horti]
MNKELLDKYFSGECTEREAAEIERWLGTHEPLPTPGAPVNEATGKAIWKSLRQKINVRDRRPYLRMAAAAATLLAVATTLYVTLNRSSTAITWQTINNPGGKEVRITLPDNSVIQLNGGTTLQYPSAFRDERTVKLLAGEAFFDIAQDAKWPFFVETAGEGRIQVLGTSFNVKYTRQSTLELTLASGKIKFSTAAQQVALMPGQQLTYTLASKEISPAITADTGVVLSWTGNLLHFRNTPLKEVFEALESRYGVTFEIAEPLTPQTISGKFSSRSLEEILSLIEKTTDVKFKLQEKRVTVTR